MGARLQAKIERIEQLNAPLLNLIKSRRAMCDHFRQRNSLDVDYALRLAAYLGCSTDGETIKCDLLTFYVLAGLELEARFPHTKRTADEIEKAMVYVVMRTAREFYGREITFEEAQREIELIQQAERDFQAGLPADESEAARHYRSLNALYPRLKLESDSMAAYLAGADVRTL